jgi:hypothetical protein
MTKKNHRPGSIRLGDRVTGEWRTLNGRAPISGVLIAASHGFVTIHLDDPVDFKDGDTRTEVSFSKDETFFWRTVADGPTLTWDDVTGSFLCQALTPAGLAKCGIPATVTP